VAHADRSLASAEERARLNPLGSRARDAQPQLRVGLRTGGYVALRSLCRALLDRTYFVPEPEQGEAYSWEVRHALTDVLEEAAGALVVVGAYTGDTGASRGGLAALDHRLAALLRKRDVLGRTSTPWPRGGLAAARGPAGRSRLAADRDRVDQRSRRPALATTTGRGAAA